MKILNLTQHQATPDQIKAGVVEPSPEDKEKIKALLTFDSLPSKWEIERRACKLAVFAGTQEIVKIMIGGAPYLMSELEKKLKRWGCRPVYAFSRREVVEETTSDGKVEKKVIFRHLGFVEP